MIHGPSVGGCEGPPSLAPADTVLLRGRGMATDVEDQWTDDGVAAPDTVAVEGSRARNTVLIATITGLLAAAMVLTADFPIASRRAPLAVGVTGIGLSAVAVVRYLTLLRRLPGESLLGPGGRLPGVARFLHRGFVMAALTLVYYLLLTAVDFFVLSSVFAAIGFALLQPAAARRSSLPRSFLFGAGTAAMLWVIFDLLLPIRLP